MNFQEGAYAQGLLAIKTKNKLNKKESDSEESEISEESD